MGFFGLDGASGLASDLRGLPLRRGVFSVVAGSGFGALIGPLSSGAGAGAAGCCTAGIAVAAVALVRFLGGA